MSCFTAAFRTLEMLLCLDAVNRSFGEKNEYTKLKLFTK